jgi:hypothetical protein
VANILLASNDKINRGQKPVPIPRLLAEEQIAPDQTAEPIRNT